VGFQASICGGLISVCGLVKLVFAGSLDICRVKYRWNRGTPTYGNAKQHLGGHTEKENAHRGLPIDILPDLHN
jgi:hypothetical protein